MTKMIGQKKRWDIKNMNVEMSHCHKKLSTNKQQFSKWKSKLKPDINAFDLARENQTQTHKNSDPPTKQNTGGSLVDKFIMFFKSSLLLSIVLILDKHVREGFYGMKVFLPIKIFNL